jgi:hypothetical protein
MFRGTFRVPLIMIPDRQLVYLSSLFLSFLPGLNGFDVGDYIHVLQWH